MKRRVVLAARVLLATVALGGAALVARSHQARLVRVGGMGNACACTHRIEP
jgi:hypothetical protein